mgnify:CR=1 FL=1
MNWSDFRDAPEPGTTLAKTKDATEGQALCLTLGAFPILLTRTGGKVRAFVNACPHQYLPLDHRSGQVMSADGTKIRCSNHAAGFDAISGEGVEGLGIGCALHPIPIEEREGLITVAR